MNTTDSNDGKSEIDKLLTELENEDVPEESSSSKTDEKSPKDLELEEDEKYLDNPENGYVREIPKGKEKYYGI